MIMEKIAAASEGSTELFTREGVLFTGRATTNDKGLAGYYPGERPCSRCGGQGWAQKWQFTGLKCFDCGGAGKLPSDRFVRLFTSEKLAALDANAAKREATRQAAADARALAEARRRAEERTSCLERNRELRALLSRAAFDGEDDNGDPRVRSEFLASMLDRIEGKALDLTPGQEEAARKAAAAILAEDERRATAKHVGEIGERIELELELIRMIDLSKPYNPPFMIWVFRTLDGSSIVYKGGSPAAFDALPTEVVGEGRDAYRQLVKGGRIKVVATVKEHGRNRKTDEAETVIARPAAPKGA